MPSVDKPLQVLAELLQSGRARPAVSTERFAPSAFYDLHYRMLVIASAFEIHAKTYALVHRRIHAARLKLLQFIACRPWLVPALRRSSGVQRDNQLSVFSSQRLRRGFLGDRMHDDVVAFLVARGVFERMDAHLVSGVNAGELKLLYLAGMEHELFSVERRVLQGLAAIKISNDMLEGW